MYSVSGQALPTGSCLLAPPAHAQCQPEGSLVIPSAGTLVSGNPFSPPPSPLPCWLQQLPTLSLLF